MDVEIENGFAVTGPGDWLTDIAQPAAETAERCYFARQGQPFLTRFDLAEPTHVVASKLLVAPRASKRRQRFLRIVPFSFKDAVRTYELSGGWAVLATASRVRRIVVGEDETLTAHPTAVVAWTGKRPSGFCPRLRLRDLFLPRKPRLRFRFHGPAIVWIEGA